MKNIMLFTICIFLGAALVGWVRIDGKVVNQKPAKKVNQVVSTNTSPWLTEADFRLNPLLHATAGQTVILDLESYDEKEHTPHRGKRAIRKNSVRFLVEEEQHYSFCIPDDEPYIVRIKLKARGSRTILNTRLGDTCEAVALEPGSYVLDIFHDARRVEAVGKRAFLHRPERRRHLRSQSPVGGTHGGTLQELLTYPNFFAMSAGTNSVGKRYPHSDSSTSIPRMSLTASSKGVLDQFVWSFYDAATDAPQFTNSRPMAPWLPKAHWNNGFAPLTVTPFINGDLVDAPYLLRFHDRFCPSSFSANTFYCTPGFILNDTGDGSYTMWADILINTIFPWVDGQLGSPENLVPVMVSGLSGQNPPDPNTLVWDFTYIGYADASKMPELLEGEFAVYGQCDHAGTAFFFDKDVDYDLFAAMTNPEITPPAGIKSIKLGPSTFLEMFNNGENVANIGADVTCASEPIQTDQIDVFVDVLKFIAVTNSCINCNLTGMDFSGDDFSGADFGDGTQGVDFSGAILTNANLMDTNLSNTDLTDADLDAITGENTSSLSGAIFTGALLACTSFKGSVLTDATFDNIVVPTDHSCYTDLSVATLNVDTFDAADWRYFDLSSATIINNTGSEPVILSTIDNRLNLSGAILSRVTGLSGTILDGAELGCAVDPDGQVLCTQLIDTDLSKASLIQATLTHAALNGANLSQANLEMADLSGAQLLKSPNTLESARLSGAYLKNANLAQADLSGATLRNANWYSTSTKVCSASTWTGTCASGEETTLSNADLEGAYLNGLDLSNATLQGTKLSGTMLIGAHFTSANLSRDPTTGASTDYSGAFLQGADFTDATPTGVVFLSAYVDLTSTKGGTMVFQLPPANLNFTGYWKDHNAPECVLFSYSQPTTVPKTDSSNICPDASSNGEAHPPSNSDFPAQPAGACTLFSDIDFDW